MRLPLALLWLVVVVVFSGALAHDFVNYDDHDLIVGNPMVRDGLSRASLWWALTTSHHASFMPLTWLSHLIDVSLFGLDPAGHHATSILLHATNAVLVAVAFARYGGNARVGVVVAVLWALHPLRVESVAWVAERKDVLSGLFFLLLLLAHRHHAERPSAARLAVSTTLLAAGLLAKPMLVTVPFVLVLLDAWPLGRVRHARDLGRCLAEKAPMFLLVACSMLKTLGAQQAAMSSLEILPLSDRLGNAVVGVARYLGLTVWPADLACLYPFPRGGWPNATVVAACAVVVVITAVAWALRRRSPGVLVGWLWFLGMLVPVIGLVQVGRQAIADRYTYLPSLGLLVAVVAAVALLSAHARRAALGLAVVVTMAWAGLTVRQVPVWQDSVRLFEHALAVTVDNDFAHAALANEFMARGDVDAALPHLEAAVRLLPTGRNLDRLGRAFLRRDDGVRAEPPLRQAVSLDPTVAAHHTDLGRALMLLGRVDEALAVHARAIALAPTDARAWQWQGEALAGAGRVDDALASLDRAAALEPDALTPPLAQAKVLLAGSRTREATALLERLRQRAPAAIEVITLLARASLQGGDAPRAVALARDAVARSEGRDVDALVALADGLEAAGDSAGFRRALTAAIDVARHDGRTPLAATLEQRLTASTAPR
jgi:tetratricopeptide (TPR) repeat protein